jgi:uncharacterized damage-inducible protein DinB
LTLAEFFPYWPEVRRGLVDLVALIPDAELSWSPSSAMMPFAGHALHIAETTDFWIGHVVLARPYRDLVLLDEATGSWRLVPGLEGKSQILDELSRSYSRLTEVLAWDASARSQRFRASAWAEDRARDLHWILHHVMDHEIHHRAYIAAYLRMKGIAPHSAAMP